MALLFALPFGDALFHDKPVTNLYIFYLVIGCFFAIGGPMFPLTRTVTWIPKGIAPSISKAARDARIWIAVLLLFFLYGVAPEIYQRATVAPPFTNGFTPDQVDAKIASATAPLNEKIASLRHQLNDARKTLPPAPPSQPPSTQPLQPATYGSLYPWQIKILVDALTELKPKIPTPPNIAVARPQMVEPQIFSTIRECDIEGRGYSYRQSTEPR